MVNLNDLWPYNDVNKDKFGKTKGKNKGDMLPTHQSRNFSKQQNLKFEASM